MGIQEVFYITLLTFLPALELRASIPYALLGTDFGLSIIPFIILLNILLGEIIFFLLNTILPYLLRISTLNKIYQNYVKKIQIKAEKYVSRYGVLGLAIFIGIPLPGSGVYTGALAGFVLGFKRRDFSKANIVGVVIAGTIVTLLVLSGLNIFDFLIK